MAEHVRFHFDFICPWYYQTARWAWRLEQLRGVELDSALFSLELQNAREEPEELATAYACSARALRTAIAVRGVAGVAGWAASMAMSASGTASAAKRWTIPPPVEGALDDAGLVPSLCATARAGPSTVERVAAEHRDLGDRTRSFGVQLGRVHRRSLRPVLDDTDPRDLRTRDRFFEPFPGPLGCGSLPLRAARVASHRRSLGGRRVSCAAAAESGGAGDTSRRPPCPAPLHGRSRHRSSSLGAPRSRHVIDRKRLVDTTEWLPACAYSMPHPRDPAK